MPSNRDTILSLALFQPYPSRARPNWDQLESMYHRPFDSSSSQIPLAPLHTPRFSHPGLLRSTTHHYYSYGIIMRMCKTMLPCYSSLHLRVCWKRVRPEIFKQILLANSSLFVTHPKITTLWVAEMGIVRSMVRRIGKLSKMGGGQDGKMPAPCTYVNAARPCLPSEDSFVLQTHAHWYISESSLERQGREPWPPW